MNLAQVTYETDGHVAIVTLNRPEKLNAWTLQMASDISGILGISG